MATVGGGSERKRGCMESVGGVGASCKLCLEIGLPLHVRCGDLLMDGGQVGRAAADGLRQSVLQTAIHVRRIQQQA